MSESQPVQTVHHTDSRTMQPLPWRVEKEGAFVKSFTMISTNNKQIATFWGSDERHPQNYEWCTHAQMEEHAKYTGHACNSFPLLQQTLEALYALPDLPAAAKEVIESVMEKTYYEKVPPHVS